MKEKIQHFLWYCATSNQEILKETPTEHNKHTLIGTLVLLTALFASVSGAFAMSYMFETQTYGGYYAILFGLLWGFLIFSIDRLLISTIRKDTGLQLKKHSNLKQGVMIVLRFALAIVISVVITKPLELWLYKDQINAQIVDNVKGRNNVDEKEVTTTLGIEGLETAKMDAKERASYYGDHITTIDKDSTYQTLKTNHRKCVQEFNSFKWKKKKEKSQKESEIIRIENLRNKKYVEEGKIPLKEKKGFVYGPVLSSAGKRQIQKLKREIQDIDYQINKKKNNCEYLEQRSITYKNNLLDSLKQELQIAEKDASSISKKLHQNMEAKGVVLDSLKRINHAADRGIFGRIEVLHQYNQTTFTRRIASWLILLIFLIIETAPIIAKLVSKVGPYDYKLAALEYQAQQQEEQRKQLIKLALKTQAEVAAKALEVWKAEQIQMVEDDPYSFIKEIEDRKKKKK